jgi:hypothetical protein
MTTRRTLDGVVYSPSHSWMSRRNGWLQPNTACIGLLFAICAAAQQSRFETQHAHEVSFRPQERWRVIIHSRARTNPGGQGFYQFRAGPIIEYAWSPRVTVLGGYYWAWQKNVAATTHRPFGGLEFDLSKRKTGEVDVRFLVERFQQRGGGASGFNRYRQRVRWSSTKALAPYVSGESFFDREGWRSVRYSVGVRASVTRRVELDTGYFFEPRRPEFDRSRHMFVTSLHLRISRGGKRPDPDI